MKKADSDISLFVKDARKKLGITQEQLAEKLGCTKGNVSAWEVGRHQPSYSQLCEISEISGMPLPHESDNKMRKILELLGIDPEEDINDLDMEEVEIFRSTRLVPKENRPQLKKIIKTFNEPDSDGEEQGSGG